MAASDLVHLLFKIAFRASERLRGLYIYILINVCGGKCKGVPRVGKGVIFKYPPHRGVVIGKGCDIGAYCMFDVPKCGQLMIGDNVKLTAGVTISAAGKVSIGNNALIAEWSSIRDSQHGFNSGELIRLQPLDVGSVFIGRDVWVGRSAAVLIDSSLGDGCIVGAHSLVKRKSLEPGCVYAGMPVRKISAR